MQYELSKYRFFLSRKRRGRIRCSKWNLKQQQQFTRRLGPNQQHHPQTCAF